MTKLLNEIAYVLDNDGMIAVTGLEPDALINMFTLKHNVDYGYRVVTPALIPYTQKENSFWYDKNLVERFLFRDHVSFEVHLPYKMAPLLIKDLRRHLTFMVAPDGGKVRTEKHGWEVNDDEQIVHF